MLRLAQESDAPKVAALCKNIPVFGNQALMFWHTFGSRWQTCCLWLGGPEDGPPNYALCRYETYFTVAGFPCREQLGELARFLQMQPVETLEGDAQVIGLLSPLLGGTPRCCPIVSYRGQSRLDPAAAPCREFSRFFTAMAACCSPAPPKEPWLGRVFPLVQQQCCSLVAFTGADGAIFCGGALETAPQSKTATITSLFTSAPFRGQGYGQRMAEHLCAVAAAQGRQVYLVCGQPSLAGYYQRFGFIPCGSQGFLRLPCKG